MNPTIQIIITCELVVLTLKILIMYLNLKPKRMMIRIISRDLRSWL